MKKFCVLVLVGLLALSFVSVQAQGLKGKFGISGRGGFAIPMGAFGEQGSFSTTFSDSIMDFDPTLKETGSAKSGYGFGVNIEYFVTDNIAIGGYFDYQKFGLDGAKMEEEFRDMLPEEFGLEAVFGGDHGIQSFGAFGKYLFTVSPKVSPYLKLGVGMGKLKSTLDLSGSETYEDEEVEFTIKGERESGMKLCFNVGGGIMFQLSESIYLTGEVLYSRLGLDGSDGEVDWKGTGTHEGETEEFVDDTWKDDFDFNANRLDLYLGLSVFFGG